MERNTPIPVIPIADLRRGKSLPAAQPQAGALLDTRGRQLRDLRISVTDRCNFRCPYCMPRSTFHERYRFLRSAERLTFEEIVRLAEAAQTLAVDLLGRELGWTIEATHDELVRASAAVVNDDAVALVQEAGSRDWWTQHANGRSVPLPVNRIGSPERAAQAAAGAALFGSSLLTTITRADALPRKRCS